MRGTREEIAAQVGAIMTVEQARRVLEDCTASYLIQKHDGYGPRIRGGVEIRGEITMHQLVAIGVLASRTLLGTWTRCTECDGRGGDYDGRDEFVNCELCCGQRGEWV